MTNNIDSSTNDTSSYNFSYIPNDEAELPFIPLAFNDASPGLKSIVLNTFKEAKAKYALAYGANCVAFLGLDLRFSMITSVHDKLAFASESIETSKKALVAKQKNAPKIQVIANRSTKVLNPFNTKEINQALLDQTLILLDKTSFSTAKGTNHSFELLETATKISNLQILLGNPVKNPLDIVKQSPVILLKAINDLHEHKLNHDPKYSDRITSIVHKILPLDNNTSYKSTEEEGVNGINGSYFALDSKDKVKGAVYKPYAEQRLLGLNSEKSVFGKIARAAYILDARNQNAAYVPLTVESSGRTNKYSPLSAPKEKARGHLQAFVDNLGPYGNLSQKERKSIPVSEVHRQLTFRGRLFDPDAHSHNILWTLTNNGTIKLIPIDMDYSLISLTDPTFTRESPYNELLYLEQAKIKYKESDIKWIESWDVDGDAQALRKLELPEGSIQLMRLTSWIFQMSCHTKTPSQIYSILGSYKLKSLAVKEFRAIYENKSSTLSQSQKDNLFELNMKKHIKGPINAQLTLANIPHF